MVRRAYGSMDAVNDKTNRSTLASNSPMDQLSLKIINIIYFYTSPGKFALRRPLIVDGNRGDT